MSQTRRLAAILAVDVAGYSPLMRERNGLPITPHGTAGLAHQLYRDLVGRLRLLPRQSRCRRGARGRCG